MTLSNFKSSLSLKLKGDVDIPTDEELSILTMEAMYYIASICMPRELLVLYTEADTCNCDILRLVDGGAFIKVPDTPDFVTQPAVDHLMIDEDLTYAVIYYIGSCITTDAGKKQWYLNKSHEIVGIYNNNFSLVIE